MQKTSTVTHVTVTTVYVPVQPEQGNCSTGPAAPKPGPCSPLFWHSGNFILLTTIHRIPCFQLPPWSAWAWEGWSEGLLPTAGFVFPILTSAHSPNSRKVQLERSIGTETFERQLKRKLDQGWRIHLQGPLTRLPAGGCSCFPCGLQG